MDYSIFQQRIINFIGINGLFECFPLFFNHLKDGKFELCRTIIKNCELLNEEQKEYLIKYVDSFEKAC